MRSIIWHNLAAGRERNLVEEMIRQNFALLFIRKKPVSNFPIGQKLRDQLPRY